ncbi:MAG TPA: ATP-binding protein [Longimicrobium sp.]|jgi:signal transduction histidine kinase|uniref:ATP-binding protein n=1 Tax=Longimicrobium sp. TaxID=2029185 RepID=UPI002EDA4C8C
MTGTTSGDAPRLPVPAGLLHDLRTPLGQIIGYTEMLVEQAQAAEGHALVPDLQKVSAAGYRILSLLEENFTGVHAPRAGAAEASPEDSAAPSGAPSDTPASPPDASASSPSDDSAASSAASSDASAASSDAPDAKPSDTPSGDDTPAPGASPAPSGTVKAVRLAEFIVRNREPILAEWEAFARTCTPASAPMDITALRDHANEMLTVIAADLRTAQGGSAQAEKSKGLAPAADASAEPTAAEEHGAGRAESGFTMEQMVSEYRALRASVIRLWTRAQGALTPGDVEDLTRFNEAIDQSLAESVSRYTEELDNSKEMFLAILGHDLRTPLGVVFTSARFMLDTGELAEPHLTLTQRIAGSATRMVHMVGDLLDFTRSRLGGGIPIVRQDMSMGKVVHDMVDELMALHPERTIRIDARGDERGEWDAARIAQALTNLVSNALEHGDEGAEVTVTVGGGDEEITIAVHNRGPAIPGERLNGIFNPMKPREPGSPTATGPTGNLGLGLYIADRIVHAHQGSIAVDSSQERGTTFTVRLPRCE